ncbi:DUF2784 domain-containing protein [Tautonia rosea]|uniref:DUF2784 domain-containing protein n=1 Tax=Tautonia rosea TaxID=2728037 RepID=UPI0014738056|nr:DUF2784 domain-containing protein [Tautonia rosea]
MIFRFLADAVLVLHLAFILLVIFGGLLVLRWPKVAWIHLLVATWGALIEFMNWRCPLTPLEKFLRRLSGEAGYEGGFIEHYLLPVIYPGALTPTVQVILGLGVLVINTAIYGYVFYQRRRSTS